MFSKNTLIYFLVFMLSIAGTAHSDLIIEEKITADLNGKTFQGVIKTYITKNKILLDDPTLSKRIIFDYNANTVYVIEDAKKDVSIFSLNNFKMPVNENIYSDLSAIEEKNVLSKESGSKAKIGNYNCYEVVVYIPKIAAMSRVWLTREIEVPLADFFSFLEQNGNIIIKKLLPFMKPANAYIVESSTTIVRPKEVDKNFKTGLVNISVQDVPETLFNLPEDYRKLNMK